MINRNATHNRHLLQNSMNNVLYKTDFCKTISLRISDKRKGSIIHNRCFGVSNNSTYGVFKNIITTIIQNMCNSVFKNTISTIIHNICNCIFNNRYYKIINNSYYQGIDNKR